MFNDEVAVIAVIAAVAGDNFLPKFRLVFYDKTDNLIVWSYFLAGEFSSLFRLVHFLTFVPVLLKNVSVLREQSLNLLSQNSSSSRVD